MFETTKSSTRIDWSGVIKIIIISVLLYIGVASTVYAFRHPEQTSAQRLLNMGKAITWQ